MALVDGIKNVFTPPPREMPIYPPGNPEYAPMYGAWEQEDMTGTVGISLDNSSLIIQIESFLSGRQLVEKQDAKTGKKTTVWEQVAEPKMNEKGIRSIVMELRARLDKNTIMTYIPNYDELTKFMDYFAMNFAIFLGQNVEEFEIKENYLAQVSDFIVDQVLTTMLRGLEGNEKQGVYKQLRRIENTQIPLNDQRLQQMNKGGVFR